MKAVTLLLAACTALAVSASAATPDAPARSNAPTSTSKFTLLSGPFLLSPPGVPTAGHRWRIVRYAPGIGPANNPATAPGGGAAANPLQPRIRAARSPQPPLPDLLQFNQQVPRLKTSLAPAGAPRS